MNGIVIAASTISTGGVLMHQFAGWSPWIVILGLPAITAVVSGLVCFLVYRRSGNGSALELTGGITAVAIVIALFAGIIVANVKGSNVRDADSAALNSHYGIASITSVDKDKDGDAKYIPIDSPNAMANVSFVNQTGEEVKGRLVIANHHAHIFVGTGAASREYGSTAPTATGASKSSDGTGCPTYDYGGKDSGSPSVAGAKTAPADASDKSE